MNIAIFDYLVRQDNPAGSCHRTLVAALADEHEFTLFATQLDNPRPGKVAWVSVPSIRRPLAALFLTFHISAFLRYLFAWHRKGRYGIIQSVESNFWFGDIIYSHFCHRWFLKHRWSLCRPSGLRGMMRWLDHALHAALEPSTFRRARWIIAPSAGLANELRQEYPFTSSKIRVIPNPVELSSFRRPHSFDRSAFRAEWGFCEDDKVIVFVALGHYERKGLPLLFEALAAERGKKWKLLVVGGTPSLVNSYIQKAQSLGLAQSIRLVGHQHDVRPFLWASDLFALPSFYEVFPLGVLQASAAGCPLLITPMNGADEFLADGVSCLKIEPRVTSIIAGLRRYESLSLSERTKLAEVASGAVQIYGVDKFVSAWRDFYRSVGRECSRG